jgi:hypothetical protein
MKINKWYALSLRVIGLFVTAMIVSFSPELLRDFFADELYKVDSSGYNWHHSLVDDDWSWGYRHYLYFFMCLALFIIQAVRLFKWIEKYSDEFKA